MYWRGLPHFDPDEFGMDLGQKQQRDNALQPVLIEMAKYLAITAIIYLALAAMLSIFGERMFS
jgi:hypothetical protein